VGLRGGATHFASFFECARVLREFEEDRVMRQINLQIWLQRPHQGGLPGLAWPKQQDRPSRIGDGAGA